MPAIANPRDLTITMIINEATLHFQSVWFEADDSLTTTKRLFAYFTAGLPDPLAGESLWLLCMNPKHRPICRICLKTGPLVAARTSVREVFRAAVLAEASAIACLRTQSEGEVQPGLADGRLLWNLREMAKLTNLEFIDYFITRLDGSDYYSYQEHARPKT